MSASDLRNRVAFLRNQIDATNHVKLQLVQELSNEEALFVQRKSSAEDKWIQDTFQMEKRIQDEHDKKITSRSEAMDIAHKIYLNTLIKKNESEIIEDSMTYELYISKLFESELRKRTKMAEDYYEGKINERLEDDEKKCLIKLKNATKTHKQRMEEISK